MIKDHHNLESNNSSQVSEENLANESKITFDDFDKLNLKLFGKDIVKIIENDKNFSRDQKSCTISLNAGFGQGKTIFLEMLKNFIEKEKSDKYTVLFINAWKNDFFKEPLITILSEFLEYLEKNNQNNTIKDNKVIRAIKDNKVMQCISPLISKIAVLFLKTLGINMEEKDIKDILKNILTVLSEDKKYVEKDIFKKFKQRKEILKEIEKIILNYTKDGKKLVIIVDELDRTKPDYAIHFLEDMKHFFDIKNVVFIFGVNKVQIEATVKTLYGNNLNFEGYYRKFFKHERNLPDPYQEAINLIKSLLKQTKTHEKLNSANIHFLFNSFKLTLRDLLSFIELCHVILETTKEDNEHNYKYSNSVLFFILLYLKKQDVFNKVLNEEFKLDKFLNLIDEEKIPYNSDEEKNFLIQVAFSFLKPELEQVIDTGISYELKQRIEDFKSGQEKIKAKFGEHSTSAAFHFLFNIHKPYSSITRKKPCLVICDAIQHQKPFYANESGFQRTIDVSN